MMSCFTGCQVFQKTNQHGTGGKKSSRPTAATPKKSEEQQPEPEEPESRRRRPPGNWWRVGGSSEDVENSYVKRREERKKQLKQTEPKTPHGFIVSISPIPPEEAPIPLLRAKPASAPKTVKRSLATFKDIFTSTTETPAVRGGRKKIVNNKHMVTSSPADEITVPECAASVISMNAGGSKSSSNQKPPENSKNQPDNM